MKDDGNYAECFDKYYQALFRGIYESSAESEHEHRLLDLPRVVIQRPRAREVAVQRRDESMSPRTTFEYSKMLPRHVGDTAGSSSQGLV